MGKEKEDPLKGRPIPGEFHYDFDPGFYNFYKTPDGEDCLEKTYYYTKYAGVAGAVCATYEMACRSPQTIIGAVSRFSHIALPFAGTGLAFGSTLCIISHLRKKNDVTNHILAGAMAGSVWGFKYNRIFPGHVGAVFIGTVAGILKYFAVNNIPFGKYRDPAHRDNHLFMDFSIKFYDDPGRPNEP